MYMVTIYREEPEIETGRTLHGVLFDEMKGLERLVEHYASESKRTIKTALLLRVTELCSEFSLDSASKFAEVQKAIDEFIEENMLFEYYSKDGGFDDNSGFGDIEIRDFLT